MTTRQGLPLALVLAALHTGPALAQALPTRIATCVTTRIERIGTRLEDGTGRPVPGSGSAVTYANRGYQVSYNDVAAITQSRRGDAVILCLVALPQDCPPGDARGRSYTATNLRTLASWTLPDSEHSCGGA